MAIPFVDLGLQHRNLGESLIQAIQQVVDRGDFILGEAVERFELHFADYCGVKHAIGVDSGLSALELTLRAIGIGPGDEVIVPANTFVATAAAVSVVGAVPTLVDVDPERFTIDADAVDAAVTSRTRAILPVHLYGQAAEMRRLRAVAERHHLVVIEDACQAHGAAYEGARCGALGAAACFSFYPGKNLGALGDGGMIVTSDAALANKLRMMRNYGQPRKYEHRMLPLNRRLDTIQAAVLALKLQHLDEWNQSRRRAAREYNSLLADNTVRTPAAATDAEHVYHLYVVRTPHRELVRETLGRQGIATGIHYPIPIHMLEFYASLGYKKGAFPVTEQLADQILSLPMFPEITTDQVQQVAAAVRAAVPASAAVRA